VFLTIVSIGFVIALLTVPIVVLSIVIVFLYNWDACYCINQYYYATHFNILANIICFVIVSY